MLNMILLFIGTTEIIVIGGIALLIFGGKKLPELMRGLGKGVKEFKEGMNEVKEDINNNDEQPQREEQKKEETPQEPKDE
ncbi:MAG: twin-arginine translocase TatA/TatE family subunit [Paludibacteraceae bacterium]|nr:twin-arginine translocase TatA/TatE family subunit [Paludibacteraceae bacterium]